MGIMSWRLLRTILILPGTALIFVPVLILWAFNGSDYAHAVAELAELRLWLAIAPGLAGLALAVWTVRLFATVGEGTPAPWDPPQKLVVRGPYRYVRNPMITSVLLMLSAEALIFGSWPLAGWLLFFFTVNNVYFPLSEEKGLEKRFGDDYRVYKANVPRWFPRLSPWDLP